MKDIDRLEVASDQQIDKAIIVIIEGNRLDGIHIAVEPGYFGHVAKRAIPHILVEDTMSKAYHQQIGKSVIVVVKPERVG